MHDDDILGCRAGQVVDRDGRREVVNCHEVLPSIQFNEISPNFYPWALAIAVLSQGFFLVVGLHPLSTMHRSVLLSALCLGPYLASATGLVLVSTCCHSQDGQSAASSPFQSLLRVK